MKKQVKDKGVKKKEVQESPK
ncbi:hypothetical protein TrRE_jg1692, partial [Triparma retinervis]